MKKRSLTPLAMIPLLLLCGEARAKDEVTTRHLPSLLGPSGLLRVFSADTGKAGTFSVQLVGEFFRATEFLALNPSDTNTRVGGRLHLRVSPLSWFEAYAALTAASNDNTRGVPNLIQTQGDFTLGVKGCYSITPFFCLGAQGAATFLTGAGDTSFKASSTSFLLRMLATFDLRRKWANIPLRIHFNFGGIIDNSDALLDPRFDDVQRFGLRIAESSRLFLGLGFEAPVSEYVTPFVEWSFEVPVGLPEVSNDAGASAYPNILSLGARVFPWRGLALLASLDLGITSAGRRGVPPIPPWQMIFGVGWTFDTAAAPARVVEKVKIKEVVKTKVVTKRVAVPTPMKPTTGSLTGAVVNARTAAPVLDAAIRFPGTSYTAALSGKDGRFKVSGLKPGKLRIRVEKQGYRPADFEVAIQLGKPTANSFPIDRIVKPKMAVLVGKLTSQKGRPLVGIVSVRNLGTGTSRKLAAEPSSGAYVGRFEVGQYLLTARSTGYLSRAKTVVLRPNERVVVDFSLRKEPEKRAAKVVGTKIVITKKINFKSGSAKIIGKRSFAILDEVVDILARHRNIKRLLIEGHTDNVGGKKFNQGLSDRRARSVMAYLVGQGVSPARLSAEGYGQSRPLVPNTSRRNKGRNRRVEFTIMQQ